MPHLEATPLRPAPPIAAKAGEVVVARMICASQSREREHIYSTMESIRERALCHNPAQGIHAALIWQSGWFIHWAEGPLDGLRALFDRIRLDGRHFGQQVVHLSEGRRLLLTPWSMMLSGSRESPQEFGRRVQALMALRDMGRQYAPHSVLRRLSAPMRLPAALKLPDPECFHRIGVCSARGAAAFDLVEWLGREHGVGIEKNRLAGETGPDSGSEFVDFMVGAYPCRVIAVARSDLAHGLRRALMQDWDLLALVFSGEPQSDDALLERVQASMQGLAMRPQLLAIAPDAACLARVLHHDRARPLGLVGCASLAPEDHAGLWAKLVEYLGQLQAPCNAGWPVPTLSLRA